MPAGELTGRPLDGIWPPDACADALAAVDQAPARRQIVFAGRDGQTVVWQVETSPLPDGGATIALRDETARYAEEQALRNAHQLHTEVLANMHGGIVVVDRELKIMVWNSAMEAISGLAASIVVGRPAPEVFPHLQQHPFPLLVQRALAGETVHAPDVPYRVSRTGRSGFVSPIYGPHRNAQGDIIGAIALVRDISGLKHAEAQLRQIERHFEVAVDGAGLGTYEWAPQTGRITGNRRFLTMLGYASDQIVPTVEWVVSQAHPADRAALRQTISGVIGGWWPDRIEGTLRLRHCDGHWLWVQHWARVLERDATGRATLVAGVHADITASKLAEAERLATDERLQLVIDAAYDGYFDWVVDTGQVVWSTQSYAMLGYDPSEFQISFGAWIHLLHPEDRRPLLRDFLAQASQRDGRFRSQCRLRHQNGTYRWVACRGQVVSRDAKGRPRRLVGIHSDITERRESETALRRLAQAIEQAGEIVFITDPEGRFEYTNPAFERVTGYTRAEVLGSPADILRPEGDANDTVTNMWQALRDGQAWSGRLVNRRKDGTPVYFEAVLSPVRNERGEVVNIVAVKRDVTTELQLERQLRQAQKMEAVGQLAGGVAHDFNNLLQVISGYSDLALAGLPSDHPTVQELNQIVAAAERAKHLVTQLLLFSRREASHPEVLDLNVVVEGLMKMLTRILGEHIECSFLPLHGAPPVDVDRHQVEQVLMNLCVNARDAMLDGGRLTIRLGLHAFDDRFCASHPWAEEGRFVSLAVRDEGCGMPPEVIERVFEPFFSTKELGKGTGLGLATVFGIVKQHHGFVHVTSAVGAGSTFSTFWPVAASPESPTSALPAPATQAGAGRGETVLLAEDDEMVRKLGARLLRRGGYRVVEARDGREALELFAAHIDDIAIVVSDVVMPHRSGYAVYQAVRELRPDVPVLLASGYSYDVLTVGQTVPEGVEVVSKPFRLEELLGKVRQLIDQAGGEQS